MRRFLHSKNNVWFTKIAKYTLATTFVLHDFTGYISGSSWCPMWWKKSLFFSETVKPWMQRKCDYVAFSSARKCVGCFRRKLQHPVTQPFFYLHHPALQWINKYRNKWVFLWDIACLSKAVLHRSAQVTQTCTYKSMTTALV